MDDYAHHLMFEARSAELIEQARRARLVRQAHAAGRGPSRLRLSTARLLISLATRLDDGLRPAPVPASVPGTGD